MAKKKSGPPPHAAKWLEERKRGLHQGLQPKSEHSKSIWDTTYIPERRKGATDRQLDAAEKRLGVKLPAILRKQLKIQNGGMVVDVSAVDKLLFPAGDDSAIDGINVVQDWTLASHSFDFDHEITETERLVVIASHSESSLCLDYRKNGPKRIPSVTSFFLDAESREHESVKKMIQDIVSARAEIK